MSHEDLRRKKNYKPEYYNIKVSKWEKKRSCLKCGSKFHSNGPENRICTKCNLTNLRIGLARDSLNFRLEN
jgi:ribosomal protein S27AE